MKRLLPLLLIAILIVAACGELDSETTASPSGAEQNAIDLPVTPTLLEMSTSSGTPVESATPATEAYAEGTGNESRRAGSTQGSATAGESTPGDSSEPNPTAMPTSENGLASPTPTDNETDPAIYPTFPALPEATSCDDAADLTIERIQFWLDAMALMPDEAIWNEGLMPEGFEHFSAQMDEQMNEIEDQATRLGCSDTEMEKLVVACIGQLVANNSHAELVLEMLQEFALEGPETATSQESGEPAEEPVIVTIESCDEAADIFIERMQLLVMDAVAGMTLDELEGMIDPPNAILQFVEGMRELQLEFQAIGCSDRDVTRLVGERLDRLVAEGPAAQELFEALEDAVMDGNLFDDLS